MKCPKCGAGLDDYARICDSCGLRITMDVLREYEQNKKARSSNENGDSSEVRKLRPNNNHTAGGRPRNNRPKNVIPQNNPVTYTYSSTYNGVPDIVRSLKNSLVAASIIWIVIGCLQLISVASVFSYLPLLKIVNAYSSNKSGTGELTVGITVLCVIAIINIVIGSSGIVKANKLKYDCHGIVDKYPISVAIVTYIWNGIVVFIYFSSMSFGINVLSLLIIILIIAATLVDLIGVRLYVRGNKEAFNSFGSLNTVTYNNKSDGTNYSQQKNGGYAYSTAKQPENNNGYGIIIVGVLILVAIIFGAVIYLLTSNGKNGGKQSYSSTASENRINGKQVSHDYDDGNFLFSTSGYRIRIPQKWNDGSGNNFIVTDKSGKVISGLSVSSDISDKWKNYTVSDLKSDAQKLTDEMVESIKFGKVIKPETVITNATGITMVHFVLEGIFNEGHGTILYYAFTNPSHGGFFTVYFFQGDDAEYDYSKDLAKVIDSVELINTSSISQSNQPNSSDATNKPSNTQSAQSSNNNSSVAVSSEYQVALQKAQRYSDLEYLSKNRLLNQLMSQYGEGFSKDVAQYAIDNIKVDWKYNALQTAQSYIDNQHMSEKRLFSQLTSEYGEGFTEDEAQYAIQNVKADYNMNALYQAKSYRDDLNMSTQRIYDQLVSEYGEGFTADQAQYAIDHLN